MKKTIIKISKYFVALAIVLTTLTSINVTPLRTKDSGSVQMTVSSYEGIWCISTR